MLYPAYNHNFDQGSSTTDPGDTQNDNPVWLDASSGWEVTDLIEVTDQFVDGVYSSSDINDVTKTIPLFRVPGSLPDGYLYQIVFYATCSLTGSNSVGFSWSVDPGTAVGADQVALTVSGQQAWFAIEIYAKGSLYLTDGVGLGYFEDKETLVGGATVGVGIDKAVMNGGYLGLMGSNANAPVWTFSNVLFRRKEITVGG